MIRILVAFGFALAGMSASAFADAETVMVSINKSVPAEQAAEMARRLEHLDPSTGTCYFQSRVIDYSPYPSCASDPACPYWGVAITELSWNCQRSESQLKTWLDRVQQDPGYTIYADGPIGPFPVVSGGN